MCRSEAEALLQRFYPGKMGPKQLRSLVPPAGISCEWLQQLLLDKPPPQVIKQQGRSTAAILAVPAACIWR
jgi:hypothetical protein